MSDTSCPMLIITKIFKFYKAKIAKQKALQYELKIIESMIFLCGFICTLHLKINYILVIKEIR